MYVKEFLKDLALIFHSVIIHQKVLYRKIAYISYKMCIPQILGIQTFRYKDYYDPMSNKIDLIHLKEHFDACLTTSDKRHQNISFLFFDTCASVFTSFLWRLLL